MPTRRRFIQGIAALGAVACRTSKTDTSEFVAEIRRSPEPEIWTPEEEVNEEDEEDAGKDLAYEEPAEQVWAPPRAVCLRAHPLELTGGRCCAAG